GDRTIYVVRGDMRIRVAGGEVIEKSGTDRSRNACHQAGSGSYKSVLHRRKAVHYEAPLRDWRRRVPCIMYVAEGSANIGCDLVIETKKFLAPVRGLGNHGVVTGADAGIAATGGVRQWKEVSAQDGESIGIERAEGVGLAYVVTRKRDFLGYVPTTDARTGTVW